MLKPIYWNGIEITLVFSINGLQEEILYEPLGDVPGTASCSALSRWKIPFE